MHPIASLALLAILAPLAAAADAVHHDLRLRLDPISHRLTVADTIQFAADDRATPREFTLHPTFTVRASEPAITTEADAAGTYHLAQLPADGRLTLTYDGVVDFQLSDAKEEYTRGFRDTLGAVGEAGVYLAGSTAWLARFGDELVTFRMTIDDLPDGWHVISQGEGTSRDDSGDAHWQTADPMDEVYLVGGPLRRYQDTAGAVEALVYLHAADDALAAQYLGATAQYLEMYRGLIGPYPYGKFALVENFWETGYGMPSFTLLGPTVIRFPFILTSSYPHEILHNWWGNSVFVDYASGNWCEGLTAYLADHLIQEQRGKGEVYRRDTLQKYRDYVKDGRDFPLREFRSRHDAATEAVGYGKALMGFHMLRRHLGDDVFRAALTRFYRAQRGKRAGFADLAQSFEAAGGESLAWFFQPWLERTGAPVLALGQTEVRRQGGTRVVSGTVEQRQDGEPFVCELQLVLHHDQGEVAAVIRLTDRSTPFTLALPEGAEPLVLDVDPHFDVFRLLDPRETPPALGQLFGEPHLLALLPSAEGDARVATYRTLLDAWQSDNHAIEIRRDDEIDALPADRAVWIAGRDNRFAKGLFADGALDGLDVAAEQVHFEGAATPFADHSLVVVRRHPANLDKAVGWLVLGPDAAAPGLVRKLPHYGKYSYLAFQGDEPTNDAKGTWPATDSPLRVDLRPEAARHTAAVLAAAPPRAALADLPAVFSSQRLHDHVAWLAAPEREGRGLGSAGLRAAADYIAEQFRIAGLAPGGDAGSYLQRFTVARGKDGVPVDTWNVIGVLRGTRTAWQDQSVVVSAHYDHLGLGWPDAHQADVGKIHPGADDNASGVAVLIELAKNLVAAGAPPRNLVFAAFSAEEAGRLGSRHFVTANAPMPTAGVMGNINLDTVGRLGARRLSVLGTGTTTEWQHIFRGCGFVTGIDCDNIPGSASGSDQMSFIEVGIPGVQIFTQAHADYHRPTDTPDLVDIAGLVKVATFVKEALNYLVAREEPLTVTIDGTTTSAVPAGPPAAGRSITFGSVPDYAFQGAGVRFESIVAGSPAAEAGVLAGDVLTAADGKAIGNLQDFSDLLKRLTPGQTVSVTLLRGSDTITAAVTVRAR